MPNKKYELVEYDGRTVRKYPDGALRDDKGHYVKRSPQAPPLYDSQSGAIARQGQVDGQRAMRKALMLHPDAGTPEDGLVMIAEHQIELASSGEKGSTPAAEFVWDKGGYNPAKEKKGILDQPAISLEISNEGVAHIMAASVKRVAEDVVEGEFTEEEE